MSGHHGWLGGDWQWLRGGRSGDGRGLGGHHRWLLRDSAKRVGRLLTASVSFQDVENRIADNAVDTRCGQ